MFDNALLLGSAALLALMAACAAVPAPAPAPLAPEPVVDRPALALTIPRPPAPGESLRLRVHVGPLAPGDLLVVRTADGASVGSIAPFGAQAREKGGAYTLTLPPGVAAAEAIDLRFEIHPKGPKGPNGELAVRPPTSRELLTVELVYAPVNLPVP